MNDAYRSARITRPIGKPVARERLLIDRHRAATLGRLFKVFASDTRLRLLHALEREGELSVGELAATIEMAPQAVSNQLQRLADRGMVAVRREGTRLYYSIADPCVAGLLELGLCLVEETDAPKHRRRGKGHGSRG